MYLDIDINRQPRNPNEIAGMGMIEGGLSGGYISAVVTIMKDQE